MSVCDRILFLKINCFFFLAKFCNLNYFRNNFELFYENRFPYSANWFSSHTIKLIYLTFVGTVKQLTLISKKIIMAFVGKEESSKTLPFGIYLIYLIMQLVARGTKPTSAK